MKRSKHYLSNYRVATGNMGVLYPVQLQEVLPGDTFRMATSAFIRLAPMLAPPMHPVTVRLHHWFVPYRILWDGWEDFITGGPNNDNADTIPMLEVSASAGTLADYMGLSKKGAAENPLSVSALPFRAYNMIWNNFYRDQDLQSEVGLDDVDLLNVAWRKDYFTAARPWQQKGPDISLPIGNEAPLKYLTGIAPGLVGSGGKEVVSGVANGSYGNYVKHSDGTVLNDNDKLYADLKGDVTGNGVVADLTAATGVTATEFREFFALQRYAEARARYGSRYVEYLRYLGIRPSDARLQLPEYLGGGKSVVSFSEVMQTATDADKNSPIGTLRGHGVANVRSKPVRRFFEEHGVIITLMSVVPRSIYATGNERFWFRQDKEDFYQKELQSIGQQPVWNKEIYADGSPSDDEIFGYSDRYSEYTRCMSKISGDMKTAKANFWHFARDFAARPNLNENFIKCIPTKRVFADYTEDAMQIIVNNNVVARRMVKSVSVGRLL